MELQGLKKISLPQRIADKIVDNANERTPSLAFRSEPSGEKKNE